MFVLAHLSDPHLAPLPAPRLADLAGKRMLGYLHWRKTRQRIHRRAQVDRLVADLHAQAPDHIAVTGDLVNIALPAEYAAARAWLDTLGDPHDVTLVPGNHDAYVGAALAHLCAWQPFMRGDEAPASALEFPFVRRRGPLALVGLSSAVPTAPFMATGELGAGQIARLDEWLPRLAGFFRVVMLHHPPVSPRPANKRLVDAAEFLRVIAAHGAELVLHGHDHLHMLNWLSGPNGARVPAVGVPSASAAPGTSHDAAAYNLYAIDGAPGAWRCEMTSRGTTSADAVLQQRRVKLLG
jgi:3',5'-cyclic AMP phosphodiesterase CpdA